ncbi:Putative tetratricopeptide-like helical domain superfamily [Septoria linicola]|uniref:Tetratricopeptide-like helical domain superfamily n=1 Tax=Septoria linicola TaxID=215465 RepID=A0A9Q9B0L1_9PEZI|nr:putative tetratricopeptide-like helical domain superfamily [Septoria linicola]USW55423.1 Putative tetratricopeptide-like helical domain superfamily [Septoria linicola]
MDSPISPSGSVRRHARNISHPVPQRAARGPLEAATDDPLADAPASPAISDALSDIPAEEKTSSTPRLPEPVLAHRPRPNVDLRFLQDRQLFHSVTTEDIPNAYINSQHRPPVESSLSELVQGGHFRRAAEAALRALLQSPPTAAEQIFQLLYTRLACLVLISRPDIAAAEAIPLIGLTSRGAPGSHEVVELIPWDLRILLVRLQSIGAADSGRRGIMALYALASEVRANIRLARRDEDAADVELWNARLHDLGLRVCDALVERGELETATKHLETLTDVDADELAYRKALLRLRVGDIAGTRQCAKQLQDDARRKTFEALLEVADGKHENAVTIWKALIEEYPGHEQFALNAAVSLFYTGHIAAAGDMLESLAQEVPAFPTLLFNLSTIYELCTERAPEKKLALVQQAASRQPGPATGGWEHATFEFKL